MLRTRWMWWRNARAASAMTVAVVIASAAAAGEPPLQAIARATVGDGQGVFAVAADGTVLAAQAADQAVHPASVTKVATTLALLERLGPDFRFTTRVRAAGALVDGGLGGDLVVEAGGDPFFIDESAVLVLRRLRGRGLRAVDGRLVTRGPFLFDWQPDPDGRRLAAVWTGRAGADAWAALAAPDDAASPTSFRDAALAFRDRAPRAPHPSTPPRASRGPATLSPGSGADPDPVRAAAGEDPALVVYRSPRLLRIVKVLNGYSNNVFQFAADAVGGAAAVEACARGRLPEPLRSEVVIENGAGAGTANRLSPRAAVALLAALERELAGHNEALTAALPVSGIDPGTLAERFVERPGLVVGKTGTSGSVGASALAGAVRTHRWGVVRFAVLNHGVPVREARARQDAFVRALVEAGDGAEPWSYVPGTRAAYLDAEID